MPRKIKIYYVSLSKKGRQSKKYGEMFGYGKSIMVKALNVEGAKIKALRSLKLLTKFKILSFLKTETDLL